jgi:uncharacterized protein involved in tolerance to divalent cations
MKNFGKFNLAAIIAFAAIGGATLTACSQKIEGTYKYIGWNGLINAEEDWKLEVKSDNTYVLSLTNDFLSAENYGNVSKNSDGTYLLKHTGSKDPVYPYPTIVYGFKAVDAAGTDWECTGNFDFKAMTFTPIVA